MSNVPKSKRKKTDFETTMQLRKLRGDITQIMIFDFGYDPERYQKTINKMKERFKNLKNADEVIQRMQMKHDSFYSQFIYKETEVILDIWQNIAREFEMGNTIFPTGAALMEEYKERRIHFDNCIGSLHTLRLELQYIAETLPSNKNRYDNIAERILSCISMVKGVRQSSNRFLKAKPDKSKKRPEDKSQEVSSESSDS